MDRKRIMTHTFLIKVTNEADAALYQNHSSYHEGDSGLDLFITADFTIPPGEVRLVGLGIQCQLLETYGPLTINDSDVIIPNAHINKYSSYLMYPRSSICKTPLILANGVGLCDSGYLGELKAALRNLGSDPFTVKRGERYVQLARADLGPVNMKLVSSLRETSRGSGGFGSTGK